MTSVRVVGRRGWQSLLANGSLVFVVFLVAGCTSSTPATIAQPTPSVTVAAVESREIVDFDEYTGKTEASEIVEIRSRIFGFLKSIDFTDGQYVEEGATLFTIEPDEYQAIHEQSLAKIAVNNANLELSRSKLAMKERLRPNGAISQEEYEEAVAAVHEAEATIAAAKADANRTAVDLKYTEIKAPISGRVDRAAT
jgi:RND family efflux transporter MFP subunit